MPPTNSDSVCRLVLAISFRPSQNASSRLTLVLCPASTIERFTTVDFMAPLLVLAAGLSNRITIIILRYWSEGFFERIRYHRRAGELLRRLNGYHARLSCPGAVPEARVGASS